MPLLPDTSRTSGETMPVMLAPSGKATAGVTVMSDPLTSIFFGGMPMCEFVACNMIVVGFTEAMLGDSLKLMVTSVLRKTSTEFGPGDVVTTFGPVLSTGVAVTVATA